jgi:hypothetical protein
MAIDYSKLSDNQLLALDSGDFSKLSDKELLDMDKLELEPTTKAKEPYKEGFMDKAVKGIYNDIPEIAGSVVGGAMALPAAAAATLVGGPYAGLAVESGAQGLGGAAGGALKQVYQQVTGSPNAPQTSGAAMKELGTDFVAGAAGAVIGRGMTAAGEAVLKPVTNALRPTLIAGANSIKEAFKAVGGKFLPAQITDNAVLDFAENFVESTFTGGDIIRVFKKNQQQGLAKMADSIVDTFSNTLNATGAEEGGKLALQGLVDGETAFKAAAKTLYSQVDEATKEAAVSTLGMKQIAADLSKELATTKGIASTAETAKILKIVKSLDDDLPFTAAHEVRSQLRAKLKDLAEVQGEGFAKIAYSKLSGGVDEAMKNAASSLGGEAQKLWKVADPFYREGVEVFNNKLITQLAKKEPARLGEAIFAKGNVATIQNVKAALKKSGELTKNPEMYDDIYKNLQAGHFDGLLKSATDPSTGSLNGKAFLKAISDPKSSRTLEAMYSPEQMTAIRKFAEVADTVASKSAGKGGGIAGAMTQVGGAGTIASGIFSDSEHKGKMVLGGVSILFAPYALARLMTSPAGAKFLTEGVQATVGGMGKTGASAIGNLISYATEHGLLDHQEKDNGEK